MSTHSPIPEIRASRTREILETVGMLVILHLMEFFAGQYKEFLKANQELLQTLSVQLVFLELINFIFSLLIVGWWWFLCARLLQIMWPRHVPQRAVLSTLDTVQQIMIEELRSYAGILWRLPLLIIPAVLKSIRWVFLPAIVLFESSYHEGKVDALEHSEQISQGHFGIALLCLFLLFLPGLMEAIFFDFINLDFDHTISVAFAVSFIFLAKVATSFFYLRLYFRVKKDSLLLDSSHEFGAS
jgi:hypothetical protein